MVAIHWFVFDFNSDVVFGEDDARRVFLDHKLEVVFFDFEEECAGDHAIPMLLKFVDDLTSDLKDAPHFVKF